MAEGGASDGQSTASGLKEIAGIGIIGIAMIGPAIADDSVVQINRASLFSHNPKPPAGGGAGSIAIPIGVSPWTVIPVIRKVNLISRSPLGDWTS